MSGVLIAIGVTAFAGWLLVDTWRHPETRWPFETEWRPKPETLASPWIFALHVLFYGGVVVWVWVSLFQTPGSEEDQEPPPPITITVPTLVLVPTTEPPLR